MATYSTTISFDIDDFMPDLTQKLDVSLTCTKSCAEEINGYLAEVEDALKKGAPFPERFAFLEAFEDIDTLPFKTVEDNKIVVESLPIEHVGCAIGLVSAINTAFPEIGVAGKCYNKQPAFGKRVIYNLNVACGEKTLEVEQKYEDAASGDTNVPKPVILEEAKSPETEKKAPPKPTVPEKKAPPKPIVPPAAKSVPEESTKDGAVSEPSYFGTNGRIDAMAVAWLFEHDYVFFKPDEITWDGRHHGIAGAQVNSTKIDDIPAFMEDAQKYYQGIGDLLMTLEQDEELIVPRKEIHPGLHDAIREGDLTGITLFNLMACGSAFMFLDDKDDAAKRNMMQSAGLESMLGDPDMMERTYAVSVDRRLTRGIPGFYRLICRMFEDMRAYNGIDSPFNLVFASMHNLDADQYLPLFEDSVAGAVSESFHVEASAGGGEAFREDGQGDGKPKEAAEEGGDERSLLINMLELFVLSTGLAGGFEFPQDVLDELERAKNGDETVDLEDLASRMHELAPKQTWIDPDSWTFDQGLRAKGSAFSVAIPDGYDIHEDVENFIGKNRDFVAVVSGTDEQGIGGSDQIVYVDHGLLGVLSDYETLSKLREWGTTDLLVYFQRAAVVESYDYGVRVRDERLVPCVNGKCLVTLRENFGSSEFYITPLMFNSSAWLKVSLSQYSTDESKRYMDAVCNLASTVELAEPPVCDLMSSASSYKRVLASADEIVDAFEKLSTPMMTARGQDVEAAHQLFLKENPIHSTEGEVFAQARALTRWGDENVDVLQLLVDVYEFQREAGMPFEDQKKLYDYLATDFCQLFKMNLGSEGEPWDVKAKKAGVLRRPEGFDELERRWKAMKPAKVAVPAAESASARKAKRSISEEYKIPAIPRIEKALNEPVSAEYYVETSEKIAERLMSDRQKACDAAVSSWSSDEDNVAGMAREFGRFNGVICRYFGYLVDMLEAQVAFGVGAGEVRRMAEEAEEFSELVADRFSCGNAYLDGVANRRSPVTRPASYASICARLEKISGN